MDHSNSIIDCYQSNWIVCLSGRHGLLGREESDHVRRVQ